MANMSYCRFQNTLSDLEDCQESFMSELSRDEAHARTRMIQVMIEMLEEEGFTIEKEGY